MDGVLLIPVVSRLQLSGQSSTAVLLTSVETLVRSEGGVGVLLANQSKHLQLASVAALQLVIFAVGMLQDFALVALKNLICPHTALKVEDEHGNHL